MHAMQLTSLMQSHLPLLAARNERFWCGCLPSWDFSPALTSYETAASQRFACHLSAASTSSVASDACVLLLQVNDTVSDLGVVLMDNNSWPELVPALFEMVQTGHERLISSALSVFAELALYVVESLIPAYDTIQQMLGATMGHPSLEVQLASLRVISAFIQVRALLLLLQHDTPAWDQNASIAPGLHWLHQA
jgi:hypothetical protein